MALDVSSHHSQAAASETINQFLPNLFIPDAMKCGKSTLHAYLDELPDVSMSNHDRTRRCLCDHHREHNRRLAHWLN